MSKLSSPIRRAVLAGLAVSVAALPCVALGQPATAAPAASSATTETVVKGAPGVTSEAWAAGRAAHGKRATATQAVTTYWTAARMKAAKPMEDSAAFQAAVKRYERSQKTKEAQDEAAKNEDGTPMTVGSQGGLLGKESRTASKKGLRAAAVRSTSDK